MSGSGSLQSRWLPKNAVVAAVACAVLAVSQTTNVYSFMQGTPETRAFGSWGFALALMLPTWALMAACAPLIVRLARTYTFAPQNRARSAYRNGDPATLRLVERFTRTAADKVEWRVTVDDRSTWTRPWTFSIPLTMNDRERVLEYACHEGNHGISNILSAARTAEKEK